MEKEGAQLSKQQEPKFVTLVVVLAARSVVAEVSSSAESSERPLPWLKQRQYHTYCPRANIAA